MFSLGHVIFNEVKLIQSRSLIHGSLQDKTAQNKSDLSEVMSVMYEIGTFR